MNIAQFAVKRPVLVAMLIVSLVTLGVLGYSRLPVDLLPSVELPNLIVTVVYPGASAEEVENLVAKEIESEFSGLEGIDLVRSISKEGVAIVVAQFNLGVDIKFAEIKVREKMQLVRPRLPGDIQEPLIRRISLNELPIMYLSLKGDKDLARLRDILIDEVKPRLEQLPGMASIDVQGGRERIVKITIDKALLTASGISFGQITEAIRKRNINLPAGEIKGAAKNITVRVVGKYASVEEIANTPINAQGRIVRLKDVAGVDFTLDAETTRARVGGQSAVLMLLYKQSGANTVKVAEEIRKAMKEIAKDIPEDVKLELVNDSSRLIERSIRGVQEDILIGAVLAVLVVWLFLGNFRSTLITAAALPNSLIGAFFFVFLAGFGVNTMTLLALSLAIGLLIDDSIVVRENIFRYVEQGFSPKEAAVKGTNEVALAVISTTLAIMAVFIPISFLSGVVGQFFKQFGLTIAFALAISLLDAFTTAPMLSAYWISGKKKAVTSKAGKFLQSITDGWNRFYDQVSDMYKSVIEWALDHKKSVLGITGALIILSIVAGRFVGSGFFASEDRGTFSVSLETYPGAPIDVIDGYMRQVEKFILGVKDVESCYVIVGGESSSFTSSAVSHIGNIYVNMKPLHDRKLTTQDMMSMTREYIKKNLDTQVKFKLLEAGMAGGNEGTPILINISGADLKVLEGLAITMNRIVLETPGAIDVDSSFRPGKPELVARIDGVKAERLGVSALDAGGLLRSLVQGAKASSFRDGEKDYDIIVQLDEKNRDSIDAFRNLVLTARDGKKVPLSAVCSFSYSSGPLEIRRENRMRYIRITANVAKGFSFSAVKAGVDKRIKKEMQFPAGYKYEFGGQAKQFADLATQMVTAMFLAVLFMYMILASLYNSFIQPFYVMLTLPLAIIGAFLALLITGTTLDVYGFIGLLLVLGLVAKNAILLVDFANQKREQGLSVREALLAAGPVRLRPILMTTFAMIFGMLPLALGFSEGSKGREALPVGVIGGLLTSTFLTLIVVPVFYDKIESYFEHKKKIKIG